MSTSPQNQSVDPCSGVHFRAVIDDLSRLWANTTPLLDALDRLPRTFCHFDAYRPNLFVRRDATGAAQVTAIDWVFAGIGGIGDEIANLVGASLIWFDATTTIAAELDQAVFDGYLEGLHYAGWHGEPNLVRFGYAAACALRWGLVGLWWLPSLTTQDKLSELETQWGRPVAVLAENWARMTYHVLRLSDEAHRLADITA